MFNRTTTFIARLAFSAIAFAVTPAIGQSIDDDWFEDVVTPGQGAVMYVWTPDGTYSGTHGQWSHKGRNVRVDDKFNLASVGKLYSAVTIIAMAEQGMLDLDAPLSDFVDEGTIAGIPKLDKITVRQALEMRTGIVDYFDDRYDGTTADRDPAIVLELIHGERLAFSPGSRFEYSNSNYLLAQIVMEQVSGLRIGQAIERFTLAPAGLSNTRVSGYGVGPNSMVTAYAPDDFDSYADYSAYYSAPAFSDSGIVASAPDVAKFYRALLIERKVLGEWGLRQLLADPQGDLYGMGIEIESGADWELNTIFGHSGSDTGYKTDVRLTLDPPVVAVVLVADEAGDPSVTKNLLWEYSE